MFRVKPSVTLGLIFFTVLIQKPEKTVESPHWLSEKFALGNSLGSPDLPSGLRPSGKSDDPQEFPRTTTADFPLVKPHTKQYYSVLLLIKIP